MFSTVVRKEVACLSGLMVFLLLTRQEDGDPSGQFLHGGAAAQKGGAPALWARGGQMRVGRRPLLLSPGWGFGVPEAGALFSLSENLHVAF